MPLVPDRGAPYVALATSFACRSRSSPKRRGEDRLGRFEGRDAQASVALDAALGEHDGLVKIRPLLLIIAALSLAPSCKGEDPTPAAPDPECGNGLLV